ncbi:peptide-N4-asparagine amidase [Solilutibacter silvestris]|uniref:Peptide N-acetyl-beta-D-glucosaminyl asparaginase amidase A n=1 Tax=Solilutibacter silvestris TaxID=1645665 RepID=A0A2K1Q0Z6_9GAMM|nr:peptide-N4-asparagine amidase [Lysobacter silvestris]PNS08712.1 Peptide N-acetyl-beta-D-glucosaminyl asparaginase amidase A [Lysobacter silvestris]
MTRIPAFLATVAISVVASTAFAGDVPARFSDGHDDPRTAYPALSHDGKGKGDSACTVDVLQHGFASFDPARATLDASRQCPGPWSKVVLVLDGKVKGRQYDRIGDIEVGGVTVLRTSTPEPSQQGIGWRVEKDVSAYAPLFAASQPVEMHLGNVINATYTGVFEVRVALKFYPVTADQRAIASADAVVPLDHLHEDGRDTVGDFVLPGNAERLVAEVYATGSGGGCEEFWYYATPAKKDYFCRAEQGPYREVQVLLDGKLAGIAAPYPHIYTGGWSNPYLWYAIPAPRAFDIHPIRYELTPFIGLVNDGKPHTLRLQVAGLSEGREGWKLLPNLHVWRDAGSARVRGELMAVDPGKVTLDNTMGDDSGGNVQTLQSRWQHRFAARGRVFTSHGVIETTAEREIDGRVGHRWTKIEDGDDRLDADWRDRDTIVRTRGGNKNIDTNDQRFGLVGSVGTRDVGDQPRLTSTIVIHDDTDRTSTQGSKKRWQRSRDLFEGSASYFTKLKRDQREATASSRQIYRVEGNDGQCFQRELASRNGRFVADKSANCKETR